MSSEAMPDSGLSAIGMVMARTPSVSRVGSIPLTKASK